MGNEASVGRAIRDQTMSRGGRALAALADRQHGVVSSAQLGALAPSKHAVSRLAARGSRWLAAVLAAGPGAVLGSRSAAALWCMRDSVAGWRVIRVTWRQLTEDGDTIARQLGALLATDSQQSANAPTTSR